MIVIQKELFSLAQMGDLLIEYDHFCGVLADKLQIQGKYCFHVDEQNQISSTCKIYI
jgi:hypothetical protein